MSEELCEKCDSNRYTVRGYDQDGDAIDGNERTLPETLDLPSNGEVIFYCDKCVDKANEDWWDEEKDSYLYDNCGNQPGDPDYDPDDC